MCFILKWSILRGCYKRIRGTFNLINFVFLYWKLPGIHCIGGEFSTHSLFAKKSGLKNQVASLCVIVCVLSCCAWILWALAVDHTSFLLNFRLLSTIPNEVDLLYTCPAVNITFPWNFYITIEKICEIGTGPKLRLSWELPRLSPRQNTVPPGTVTAQLPVPGMVS